MQNLVKYETAWCPGCGNFAILDTLAGVLGELDIPREDLLLVGGIGQAAKANQYLNVSGFSGLHGRSLCAATAAKMANEKLTVIVNTGDGDSYGEGGNHFIHNIRRNIDICHFVHDNQIYGLTKGQASPTSTLCPVEKQALSCNRNLPLQPLTLALAAGATFVARSFAGDKEHLAQMMKAAIAHKGYALVDILQNCVSFNKVNTFSYYKERVYHIEEGYDPTDLQAAMARSLEFGDRIPLGILYQAEAPTYQQKRPNVYDGKPVYKRPLDAAKVEALIGAYV